MMDPRLRVTTWLAGMLAALPAAILKARPISFDDAASAKTWSFNGGPEFPGARGAIAWDGREGHVARGCLALQYDFTGGGNYVEAGFALPEGNTARTVRLWIKKPGGHKLTFRTTDSGGQTFQKPLEYHFADWQQVEVDLGHWQSSWGGAKDGKVKFPARRFAVLIENSDEPRVGVLRLDDVELLASSGPDRTGLSTYVPDDFSGNTHWSVRGGAGNKLDGQNWRFAFNPGDAPGLRRDFSLMGKPVKLRLVLDTDAAGVAVHASMGSHFQVFSRMIGRLDGKGEQTIEVALGSMTDWAHRGGQDDGVVRFPLRMAEVRLEQASGPAHGQIRLKRLEVDTEMPPGHDTLLVPDAHLDKGQARFSVRVTNLRQEEVIGRLVCDIRGVDRRTKMDATELTLPASGGSTIQEFTSPMGDFNALDAVFRWVAPGSTTPPASIGVAREPESAGSADLDLNSPIGMGVYLYRWGGNPEAIENMNRVAALAQRAGVKWTREEFQWHRIEPRQGKLDWSFYDQVVDIHRRHGIQVYGLLAYWSGWTKPNTPEGIRDYANWARQVVRHYKDRVKHWEIWNEPNIFFWTGPREMYADLLAQSYAAIKAEDPEAVVMGCATSGIDSTFIKTTMDKGGKFDALSIHPYRGGLNDQGYIRELQDAHKLGGHRPLWLTEIGFPTQLVSGYSERNQASLVARIYLASLASGVAANISWYDFRNDGNDPYESEQNFGLIRSDFRLKPGYRSLATLATTLAGCRLAGVLDVGEGAYACRFKGPDRDVVVACAPQGSRVLTFDSAGKVEITNGMGEPIAPLRAGNRLTLALTAGFPVYITGRPGFTFEPRDPAVRLSVDHPHVRPGDTVQLTLKPDLEVIAWELPIGWRQPVAGEGGSHTLTVPKDAVPGEVQLQLSLRREGILRLPVVLTVQQTLLKV
ncbi:MAG TPA: beta-galactosidase [Phycisphaerae bacterium]|nr:beta-galactosidase [Phycisphaerae bacterium]HRY69321.1 beta-galactosidase [Phycisphaerae bacterium]HSA26639.1 beta-galactosidase [Phycisphaerae bacterium]